MKGGGILGNNSDVLVKEILNGNESAMELLVKKKRLIDWLMK